MELLNKLLQSLSTALITMSLLTANAEAKALPSKQNLQEQVASYEKSTNRMEICNFYNKLGNDCAKALMILAKDINENDKILLEAADVILALMLEHIEREKQNFELKEYDIFYYSTLGLKSVFSSVINEHFMELIGYDDEDFIKEFDSLSYGKEVEALDKRLQHV